MELIGLTVRFGDQIVLDRLNASMEPGSVTAVEGRSGSGKTTLLRCVLGLQRPDAGEVRGVPEKAAAVFQEDRLLERQSARANVALVCGKGVSEAEIDAHLRAVGIDDATGKRVREFSGGMRRRVALVRALIVEPDLLVLDEPFKGLDTESRLQAAAYINERKKSATVLIVTHDRAESELLGATGRIVVGA